jgi:hypothetical protein
LRWLAVVVAVMAVLTAGWPLLNATVANRHPLQPGARLTVGTGPASSAVVTVGRGWAVLPAESDPTEGYLLANGPLHLSINHVTIVGPNRGQHLWEGLRRILAVSNPSLRLGRPVLITSGSELKAVIGMITGPNVVGSATIVPGPSREFGIEMIMLTPRTSRLALRLMAAGVISSLTFPAAHP